MTLPAMVSEYLGYLWAAHAGAWLVTAGAVFVVGMMVRGKR